MFAACAKYTLETTITFHDELHAPDTFVIVGDVPAMGLRDSCFQTWTYIRFAQQDERLGRMIKGLVRRHVRSILLDPYANMFTFSPADGTEHASDLTTMKPGVFERKYDATSLCCSITLIYRYWSATGDNSVLDADWLSAMRRILEVWRVEQNHLQESGYRFQRLNCPETDTLEAAGMGTAVAFTGMTWSGFRPDGERCERHYHIPAQAFAIVALRHLAELAATTNHLELLDEANALAVDIRKGIETHALLVDSKTKQTVFAYEVDGLGNAVVADSGDPSGLLSMSWLGYCEPTDELYVATRKLVFRDASRLVVNGIHRGGGRSPALMLVMRALSSIDDREIHTCLAHLLHLHVGAARSRDAAASSLFAELVFQLAEKRPHILVDFRSTEVDL